MTRAALVTGGTRGIGKAICLALQQNGMKVAANYVGGEERANAFTAETGIPTFRWDVSDFDACQQGVAKVAEAIGPVDVLVNNAGITRDATVLKLTPEQWQDVINVNLSGAYNMVKAVYGSMRERNFGRIINIGSVNGQMGQIGQINYAAAKAGLKGLTKALALEGARYGITANEVAPGYTDTDMVAAVPDRVMEIILSKIPIGRLGKAEEVARAVAFLADENAGYITGSLVAVNGGQHML